MIKNVKGGFQVFEGSNPLGRLYENKEQAIKAQHQINFLQSKINEIFEHMTDESQVQVQNLTESEYKGKNVTLNKPFRTPGGPKKFGVYVKNDNGNIQIVRFGDPNMEIKRDDPERRKAYRARHKGDHITDKTKAGYWSWKFWGNKSVTELLKEGL